MHFQTKRKEPEQKGKVIYIEEIRFTRSPGDNYNSMFFKIMIKQLFKSSNSSDY